MGCSFSGLNALYDTANAGGDIWINENRFRILRQAGFANVFLVKELISGPNKFKDPSHVSGTNPLVIWKLNHIAFFSSVFQFNQFAKLSWHCIVISGHFCFFPYDLIIEHIMDNGNSYSWSWYLSVLTIRSDLRIKGFLPCFKSYTICSGCSCQWSPGEALYHFTPQIWSFYGSN